MWVQSQSTLYTAPGSFSEMRDPNAIRWRLQGALGLERPLQSKCGPDVVNQCVFESLPLLVEVNAGRLDPQCSSVTYVEQVSIEQETLTPEEFQGPGLDSVFC